ncbi:MAG TPA: menaquinone biosynthesis protein [Candidatus Thermoplasmatota archaeon]|nr:menaquinone biosynthesis protein [Candidatus Thermoplasmatota archaeon]
MERARLSEALRVGVVDFLNSKPIVHAIETGRIPLPPGVEIVRAAPARLNAMLREGLLDASFVSSIEFARSHRDLALLRGLSINSRGFVDSVVLFHAGLPALAGGTIGVTGRSATSDVLLRILLARRYGVEARLEKGVADLARVGNDLAGVLLIGDEALAARDRRPELLREDLGHAWHELTGLPMVFAVFAARRDALAARGRLLRLAHRAILTSRDWGMENLDAIAPSREARAYFDRLDFRLEGDILDGLRAFYEHAYKIGELRELPPAEALRDER